MSANLAITQSDFDQNVLKSEVPVLVDFWAPWCGPCRAIAPDIEALAEKYAGQAKVYKLDVDEEPDIASQYGVQSIPTLLVFKGGKVVEQRVGGAPRPVLAAMIDRAL